MTKKIRSSDTKTVKTEMVLPNDTNTLNNLMGGMLLHWMDICAAISAQRLTQHPAVTAAVNNVMFKHPIKLGDVVTLESYVTRVFNTSLEVFIEVYAQDCYVGVKRLSNKAYFTFVSLDENSKPIKPENVVPETEEEISQYEGALRRRQLNLILGGRLKPSEAKELKSIFN